VNPTVQPWCFHSRMRGGVLCESTFPGPDTSNPSERFVVDLILAQGRERILLVNHIVQPWHFHLRGGGGVLYEPIFPDLETSNPGEWFVIALYKIFENIFQPKLY